MGWRILIIDPDKTYSDFVMEQSDELGLSIVFADTVEVAASYVDAKPFDVVFLDDDKPDVELMEIIQELKSTKLPPDIFVTGGGAPDKVEQAVKAGASAYLARQSIKTDFKKQLKKLKKSKAFGTRKNFQQKELHQRLTNERPKILVVEDSSILRRIIKRMLKESEYEVETAVNGRDCLIMLETFQPDVILSDIVMPELGGIELCETLKGSPLYKNIPILLMSTESELGRKINGFNVGASDYLTKPFEEEELKARLTTHFLQKKLIEGLETENSKRQKAEDELRAYSNSLEDIVAERTKEIKKSNEQLKNEINERKQAQADLERSRKRYRDIVESVNEWIWEIGNDREFTYTSPKIVDILGYEIDDTLGKSPEDFMPEEEAKRLKSFLKENGLNTEKLKSFEHLCIRKDESIATIESSMVPFFDADNTMLGYRGVSRDITEIKKAKDDKAELEHQLMQSEKMASIGQLAAGVAHEINNPIGFVNSNLHSLEAYITDINALLQKYKQVKIIKDSLPDETRVLLAEIETFSDEMDIEYVLDDSIEIINDCKEGVSRVKNIVISLKDFAHPGKESSSYADINANIDSTLVIIWNELKYTTTVIKKYGDIPEVYCNVQQINQVFMNLLVNAAHAIETKGTITITTESTDSEHVEIRISDTGQGIPDDIKTKIFDPFFTTKEVGKGTGLGLNLSYNIVAKHGGSIEVESEVGKGTSFIITLKVKPVSGSDED